MTLQVVDIAGEPAAMLQKPLTWYRWYCNGCGKKGLTSERRFECHPGRTWITVYDGGERE